MKNIKSDKKKKNIHSLIENLEYDLVSLYQTGEIVDWMEQDMEYVAMTLTAVMMDQSHFESLGMVIGDA